MTPHNRGKIGEIAPHVLMPGDPLRAKYIAETYLEDVFCYNDVRNALGFTGIYRNVKVSIQSSGMGIPSLTIYAHELFDIYACKNIIRVGTCGGLQENVKVGDLVCAIGACTDSAINRNLFGNKDYAPIADFTLLRTAVEIAESRNTSMQVGLVLSSDLFYDNMLAMDLWMKYGVLAVDMETSALYTLAAKYQARSLSLLTVSDIIMGNHETMSTEQREKGLGDMIKIALDTLIKIS